MTPLASTGGGEVEARANEVGEMPILYSTSPIIVSAIMELAREFKNGSGQLWRAEEIENAIESQAKIRAWDIKAPTEHKCQIIFTITDSKDAAIVDASACNNRHYSSKFRNAAMRSLVEQFGRPPAESNTEIPSPPDTSETAPNTEMPGQPQMPGISLHSETPAQPQMPEVAQLPETPTQPQMPEVAQLPETPAQPQMPEVPQYAEAPIPSGMSPQPATPPQPDTVVPDDIPNQYMAPGPQQDDLARRVEALEQNIGRWDSLINSYLGETLEQLTSQVDTIEERTIYLQQYAVSIELNLNLLWVLRFLIDKTRIRNPEIQRSADTAVSELREIAAQVQEGLWNGKGQEASRLKWSSSCRQTLEKYGFSDYYSSEEKPASQSA